MDFKNEDPFHPLGNTYDLSNASPERLVVLSAKPYITSLEGIRFLEIIKLSFEGLSFSYGGIRHINPT